MDKNSNEEKKTFAEKLGNWLVKYRVLLLSIIGVLILAAIVTGIVMAVSSKNQNKAFEELYEKETAYKDLQINIELTDEEIKAKKDELLADILAFADKNSKKAVGSRAYMLAAEIDFAGKNYAGAADSWEKAAKAKAKSYIAPLAIYNAAICYEEIGDIDSAINNLKKASETEDFPFAPKAYFNCGRLEEGRGNYAEASEYYKKITLEYPGDDYAKLAHSRLISLETEGKLN